MPYSGFVQVSGESDDVEGRIHWQPPGIMKGMGWVPQNQGAAEFRVCERTAKERGNQSK